VKSTLGHKKRHRKTNQLKKDEREGGIEKVSESQKKKDCFNSSSSKKEYQNE